MNDLRQQLQEALKATHEIERELGGGGMSRTYVALEKALGRRVVIKILAPELLAGISVERFRREVLLAAQLQHPHVVPVLTAGDAAGLPWFTMPYVDGDSLRQRLAKGPVSITEAVNILRDVARALAYAHSHGVVHRDIKPDNVLLSAGSATVTDFGIAKAINAARTGLGGQGPALTMTGMSIGTPTYMSPEQAAGDPDTDHRADIYSFGAMAYELVAGHPPFHGLTPSKLLAAQMGERPRDLRGLRPDCPEALAAMIMQCLEKEAANRPAKATDLARVLETITSSGSAAAAPSILAGGRIRLGRALSIWAGTSVAVILTAWAAREVIGLPDWSVPGAIGVMLAGLPVIIATWYVQRTVHRTYTATPQQTPGGTASVRPQGTMATLAIKASPHISWRRTWLGGGVAVAAFAVMVVGWMVMRAAGIGPFASLRGTGAFGSSERLVVADFAAPSDDPTLGVTVAEAVRTDLAQSKALNVMSRAESRDVLARMRRSSDTTLTFELAREMATREGVKAVLDGGIVRLGRNYVVTARLVNAQDGSDLASFRETAEGEDELLPALARISRAVRERAGESLRAIRRSDDVARVTTASLPALRKYVEALRASDQRSDFDASLSLLEEAVAIDTAFAMAWRRIAVLLNNDGRDPVRAMRALERAYSHRDRLTELERQLLEGYYYTRGPRTDLARAKAAYEAAAALDTTATAGINNAGVVAGQLRQNAAAESLYAETARRGGRNVATYQNWLATALGNGRPAAHLDSIRKLMYERFPNSEQLWIADWTVARADNHFTVMDSIGRAALGRARSPGGRAAAQFTVGSSAQLLGRPLEALRYFSEARQTRVAAGSSQALERLLAAYDSAVVLTLTMEQPNEARALLARALEKYPLTALKPLERPWQALGAFAALTRDPALARRAAAGFEADVRSRVNNPVAARAANDAFIALAEGRHAEAIDLMRQADRGLEIPEQQSWVFFSRAHDLAGHPDSAAYYLRRIVEVPDAVGDRDANFYAPALTRLGEIAEQRGDTATALRYYEEFTELWKNAEPERQTKVRQIRERVMRLRGNHRG